MTRATLELSSSQISSFIIEIAVSVRVFVTSPFYTGGKEMFLSSFLSLFCLSSGLFEISLTFREGTLKEVHQLSLYAILSPKREQIKRSGPA